MNYGAMTRWCSLTGFGAVMRAVGPNISAQMRLVFTRGLASPSKSLQNGADAGLSGLAIDSPTVEVQMQGTSPAHDRRSPIRFSSGAYCWRSPSEAVAGDRLVSQVGFVPPGRDARSHSAMLQREGSRCGAGPSVPELLSGGSQPWRRANA